MKRWLPLLPLILGIFVHSALADGVVIPPSAFPTEITMPDQRALIQFANGTERLVIETRFAGAGTNFCWVVPLPSEPRIEAATTGVFTTLGFLLQPELIHDRFALFPAFTVCLILVYLLVIVKSDGGPAYLVLPLLATIALAFYSGPFAWIAFVMIAWAFHRVSGGETTLLTLLFLVLFAAILSAMLLPALGGGGSAAGFSEVSGKDHGRIGSFDLTTVASKNPDALFDWLQENGFEAPAGSKTVVEDYVKHGWVFAVAKLHRESVGAATNAIHPLSFTFSTAEPVYPMRLTGLATEALKVDLYVVGSERAAANYFKMQQCAPIVPKSTSTFRTQANELPLAHPVLKEWLQGSSVVTKLSANLNRDEMRQDVRISWEPFSPYRPTIYSRKGAATLAADWAMGSVLAGFIGALLIFNRGGKFPNFNQAMIQILSMGAMVFVVCFLILPKTSVRLETKWEILKASNSLKDLGTEVARAWNKAKPKTMAEAQEIAANEAANLKDNGKNILLGGFIREEDSPGNYAIRQSTNGFVYVWFTRDGREQPAD